MSEKQKICLVIPPSPFLADERVFPSLGILKIAAVLEARDYDVDVLDLSGVKNFVDVVSSYMAMDERAHCIGLTATTPQFPQAVQILEQIKLMDSQTRVIFGGAHATMVGSAYQLDQKKGVQGRGTIAYEQMLALFDVTVLGDGEEAIFAAIRPDAPTVIDASTLQSSYFLKRGTLEEYPFPARHLIDLPSYHYEIDGSTAQSMISQLGCPFECGFCGGRNTPSFRIARRRSTESVIAEVAELVERWGKRGIMFYDDELNISNASLIPMLEGLIKYQEEKKISLSLRGFVKAELFTPLQAKLMYRAGFRILLSGVESGDRHILEVMKKHTTPEINAQFVEYCHGAGLQAKALMSIGHPGESKQTIMNSLAWVLENRPDDVDWTIITQYPGSPYFDQSVPDPSQPGVWMYVHPETGDVLYSQDVNYAKQADYYKGVPGDYTSYVWTDYLNCQELVTLRDHVESVSREALKLGTIQCLISEQFEHSMGQRRLPRMILSSAISLSRETTPQQVNQRVNSR